MSSNLPGSAPLAATTALVGFACVTAWIWTRFRPLRPGLSHPAFTPLIVATAANTIQNQAVAGEPAAHDEHDDGDHLHRHVHRVLALGDVGRVGIDGGVVRLRRPADGHTAVERQRSQHRFRILAGAIINTGRRQALGRLLGVTREVERAAVVDSLTQAYNRRGLVMVSGQVVRTARRTGERVGVLVLDIDSFKAVNDKLGHQAGDAVLVAVADSLKATGRDSDVVARWGGDEFVVITLGGAPAAGELARRVERDLFTRGLSGGDGRPVTVSVGAAQADPLTDPVDIESLIAKADTAMYAGRAGRRDGARASSGLLVALETYQKLSAGR